MIDRSRRGRSGAEARVTALLALAVLLALPLLGATAATPPAAPPQAGSLPQPAQPLPAIAGGPAPDLDLLFTAQVAGWIEPCG